MVAGIVGQAQQAPDAWALRSREDVFSWAELNERLNRAVHVLLRADLGPNRRVAVFAENSTDAVVAHLAGILAGAAVVPVNVHLRAEEASYILANCGARVILAGARTAAVAVESAPEGALVLAWRSAEVVGVRSFEEAIAASNPAEPPTDFAPLPSLLYTSGTDGRPKGARLPASMFAGGATIAEHVENLRKSSMFAGLGPHLVAGPMYHTGPLSGVRTLLSGTPVVVSERFDAEAVLAAIDSYHVASSLMVPTHFSRLLALAPSVREQYDVSSVKLIAHTGASCPVDVKYQMIDWFGPVFLDGYGSTETGTVARIDSNEWARRPGSVGRATPNHVITIRDDGGSLLPAGQEGLVCVRTLEGPGPEYFDDPDKTASSYIAPGEFVIGEIGYLDDEGYLFLTDRHSDLVISGGVNIYPAEAEAVLRGHPEVVDVAVIGVPDADMGESLHAIVVPHSDGLDPQALIGWCRERLTHYKCPRTVELADEIPRSPMGKIDKRALRSRVARRTESTRP